MQKGKLRFCRYREILGIIWKYGEQQKAKARSYKERWGNPNRSFRKWKYNSDTFARMVNVLSGSEMDKITVSKLRDVEKLYNLEEEIGITENELMELNNRKEVADKEEEISKMQELKEREKKELKNKVKN